MYFSSKSKNKLNIKMEEKKLKKVRDILLEHRKKIEKKYNFPGLKKYKVDVKGANLFFLGAIMDYQMPADIVWDNARELLNKLGSKNLWHRIVEMSEEEFIKLRKNDGGCFHRFWKSKNKSKRNSSVAIRIRRIAENVVKNFKGDVRNIWKDKDADEVYRILKEKVQVNITRSDAIIHMIVLALVENKIIKGSANVKPDIHVKRVLGRLFIGKELRRDEDALEIANKILPDNTYKIDLPLFDIGKNICTKPKCQECPLINLCKYYNSS